MARSADLIQADLDRAYTARSNALQAQEYQVDSGQGSQRVKRADLVAINATIDALESEMDLCLDGGATHLRLDR